MRNLKGILRASVRNQFAMLTGVELGLKSSIESTCGRSVCVSTSLMKTDATFGAGSSAPGEPPAIVLARQFTGLFGSRFRFGFMGTRENPAPSGEVGQGALVPYFTEKIGS